MTFFSGTDTAELQSGGKDTNHFVSLIVNNAGTYTARITRKIVSESTIIEKCKYSTFGDLEHSFEREFVEEAEYLEWFNLQVEVQGKINPFETEMLDRIREIKEEKSKVKAPTFNNTNYTLPKESLPKMEVKSPIQRELPFSDDIPYGNIHIDTKIVQHVIKQIITCSVLISSESQIDISRWIKDMNRVYTNRFKDMKTFTEYATNHLDYIINNTKDESLKDRLEDFDMGCILAYDVMCELAKYPKNPWLDTYIKLLDDFVL